MTGINIQTAEHAGVVVLSPEGRLDLASYPFLRDDLLERAADEPQALVVRLGPHFEVPSRAMMSVFTTVWMRISQWPDIPMVLAAETDSHREDLRRSGVARLVCTVDDLRAALLVVEGTPDRRFHRVPLPNSPTAPIMARAVVREACEQWDLPRLSDDAVLVVSELVENAVKHARSESVLRIELRAGGLSLAVRDSDPAPPLLGSHPEYPGHRGVQLVDRVCRAWGVAPSSDGGKIVWALLGLNEGE